MGKGSFFICDFFLPRRFPAFPSRHRFAPVDHLQSVERVHLSGIQRVLLRIVLGDHKSHIQRRYTHLKRRFLRIFHLLLSYGKE